MRCQTRRRIKHWKVFSVMNEYFTTGRQGPGRYAPFTLTQYLGIYLSDIEALFGPRDTSFTILGIEIVTTCGHKPQTWFPYFDKVDRKNKNVIVHLGPGALNSFEQARWQLAHECVHLLNPCTREEGTIFLEEGLATWYQNDKVTRSFFKHTGRYADAERLVMPLMHLLPDAIKQMRAKEGVRLCDITPGLLRKYCPQLPLELALQLTQRW